MVRVAILMISPNTPAINANFNQGSSFPYVLDKDASSPMEIRGIEIMVIVLRRNIIPSVIENSDIKAMKRIALCMTFFGLLVICFKSTSIPARNIRYKNPISAIRLKYSLLITRPR
jgi:hypothetical protein